jgi:hypothetical protein
MVRSMMSRSIFGGPGPVEIRHGLEGSYAAEAKSPLEAALGSLRHFSRRSGFQDLMRRPASFAGARNKVVEFGRHHTEPDLFEL